MGGVRLPGAGVGAPAHRVRRRDRPAVGWRAADGCIVKAPLGKKGAAAKAEATGANPTDRAKCGAKRHLLTEGGASPSPGALGANRHDMMKLADLLDAVLTPAAPFGSGPGAAPLPGPEGLRLRSVPRGSHRAGYLAHPRQSQRRRRVPPPGHADRHPHAAGWWRRRTAGSATSAACSCAGRRRRPTPSASSNSPRFDHLPQAAPCPYTFRMGCKNRVRAATANTGLRKLMSRWCRFAPHCAEDRTGASSNTTACSVGVSGERHTSTKWQGMA